MSITTKTPKLIPIAAAVIVLLVIVFGLAQCGSDAPAPRIAADKQTGLSRAEGDTPAEVLARDSLRQSEYESGTSDMQKWIACGVTGVRLPAPVQRKAATFRQNLAMTRISRRRPLVAPVRSPTSRA